MKQSFDVIANHVAVVLVQTSHPANIGSVARAMKTMGLTDLRLVAPDDFPSARAEWLAAGAEDLLQTARVYDTFEAAIADCQLVIGTSARLRGLPWPHVTPLEAAGTVLNHVEQKSQCALVFGREARGLTNEELRVCNLHTLIPGNPEYSVLNIAQAVQVIAYELYTQWLLKTETYRELPEEDKKQRSFIEYTLMPWDEPLAQSKELEGLYQHLQDSLTEIGFMDEHNKAKIWPRLHRMFQKQRLDQKEVALLRGFCTFLDRQAKQE